MFRKFLDILKDMTASSVHTPTALGNGKPKARNFKAVLAEPIAKRALQPNTDETAKSPFPYDPNAFANLRPDQVPRFLGAVTDGHKLPTKTVDMSGLHAMQDRVDPAKVTSMADSEYGDKKAVVVGIGGKDFVADGHHRLAAHWLGGGMTAEVHYKDLDPVDNALKRAPITPIIGKNGDLEFHQRTVTTFAEGDQWPHVTPEPTNFNIAKVDETLGLVFGWAIVCKVNGEDYYDLNIDHEGQHAGKRVPEHIPEPVMLKGSLDLVKNGVPGNEMHAGPDKGTYPFVFPLTSDIAKAMGITTEKTGLMVAFAPPADVLAKYLDGTYKGFSIEGRRLSFTEHEG